MRPDQKTTLLKSMEQMSTWKESDIKQMRNWRLAETMREAYKLYKEEQNATT